jgi:hypothetical protein
MAPIATTSATSAPIAAAAAKPTRTLPVDRAAAKPPIAESISVPSAERLITPARSVNVSPIAA